MNKADIHTENVSSMVADQSNKINSTFINKVEETPVTNTIENNTTVTENPESLLDTPISACKELELSVL